MPAVNITIPQWAGWENWQQRAEDRIESALSSANGFLNWALGPVRSFVGYTLHPLFQFGDFLWRWGIDVAHWVMDRASDVGWSTYLAIQAAISDLTDLSSFLVGLARNEARNLFGQAKDFATGAVSDLRNWIGTAISDVHDFANKVYWDAIGFANRLVTDAVSFTATIITNVRSNLYAALVNVQGWASGALSELDDLVHRLVQGAIDFAGRVRDDAFSLAHTLYDKAAELAGDAIDVLRRDVWDKIFGAFQSFLSNEWHWAMGLLKILEDAAEWLVWVGRHVVPEAVDTYKALRDLGDVTIEDLAAFGGAFGGAL